MDDVGGDNPGVMDDQFCVHMRLPMDGTVDSTASVADSSDRRKKCGVVLRCGVHYPSDEQHTTGLVVDDGEEEWAV